MLVFVLVFGVVIVAKDIIHAVERRDLYDRIMSGDIKEYRTKPKPEKDKISMKKMHNDFVNDWFGGSDKP